MSNVQYVPGSPILRLEGHVAKDEFGEQGDGSSNFFLAILRYRIGATFARLFACSIHYRSTESRLFDMMHLEMGCHTSEWFFLRYATFSAISRSARETA